MARGKTVATFAGGGVAGGLLVKLSGADVRSLLSQAIIGFGSFLKTQGQYASFAIMCAVAFGGVAVWAINKLIAGKNAEITRIAGERDKFQQLFIEEWRSSISEKERKKKKE